MCEDLGLVGRVRVASEGINGTLSGEYEHIQKYTQRMDEDMDNVDWKTSWSEKLPFDDLQVRIVQEVVSLEVSDPTACDPANCGTHLSPSEFHEMAMDENAVLIDVRNTYEYSIGHFDGAVNPETRRFGEFAQWCDEQKDTLKVNGNHDKKVLMYCTGGIRCEKASAYLKHLGVSNVYQLRGGIHRYMEAFPDGGQFVGKNFVFDQRVALASRNENVVGCCESCGIAYDQISGCRCNICRMHVILCPECKIIEDDVLCGKHRYLKQESKLELQDRIIALETQLKAAYGRDLKKKRKQIKKQILILQNRI